MQKSSVRLSAASWDVAERAAAALSVSRDLFLDQLLAREVERLDEDGRPVWWTAPVPADQQQLQLEQAEPLEERVSQQGKEAPLKRTA